MSLRPQQIANGACGRRRPFPSVAAGPLVVGPVVARLGPMLTSESFQLLHVHSLFPRDHLLYVF